MLVPKYDTVKVLPSWLKDSLKVWKKRPATTQKTPILISAMKVDTQYVPVDATPENRPNIHPLLSYNGGSRFGDTAITVTFGLRDGEPTISKVFIPGILTGIDANTEDGTPRMTYAPFPAPKKPSLLYRVKMIGIGAGACMIYNGVK